MIRDHSIKALRPGEYLTEVGHRGAGRFVVRMTKKGTAIFYFRKTRPDGKRDWLPLGYYDAKGIRGITIVDARNEALQLSLEHQARNKGERSKATGSVIVAQQQDKEPDTNGIGSGRTLEELLDAYTKYLFHEKKQSAKDIHLLLQRHVKQAFPQLCASPASSLQTRDFIEVIKRLIDSGKKRTASKVRSSLIAAYERARMSESDASALDDLRGFGIDRNPAQTIASLSKYNKAGERALADWEVPLYVSALRAYAAGPVRDALLLAFLMGGQRMGQLLRVTSTQVDLRGQEVIDQNGDAHYIKTVTIFDPKGRRSTPRSHIVPIFGETEEIFTRLASSGNPGGLFGTAVSNSTSHVVHTISASLLARGAIKEKFAFRDLRRTCETQLSAIGISKDCHLPA